MLKTISFISISVQHVMVSYWPYLTEKFRKSQNSQRKLEKISEMSQILMKKIKIIYENSMIGLMIGLSFIHLMPIANQQIRVALCIQQSDNNGNAFPYGTLTSILAFVFVLANSNYFYHGNSTTNCPKRGNFRSRAQFEHQMLSNKKLKIRRRLAIQDFSTQLMISLPSVLLTSCLASDNESQIWFWCLTAVLFQKHHICSYFGKSFHASALSSQQAQRLVFYHLTINLGYLTCCCYVVEVFPLMNGIMNGITCGIIIYDVMIQKLTNNYEEKKHLFQKILFFLSGIFLSCLIISK